MYHVHQLVGEEEALAEQLARAALLRRVDDRVDQQREHRVELDRERRREVAARAVAADGDALVALAPPTR